MGSALALMSSSDKLKIITDSFKSSQIIGILDGEGPITVFAPIDIAVAQGHAGKFKVAQGNSDQFQILVKYHVVKGYYPTKVLMESLKKKGHLELEALCGKKLVIRASGFFRTHIKINDANIVSADLAADNGVIHTIDTVLFPP